MRKSLQVRNVGNVLKNIIPTFSGTWTTNPGTNADLVLESSMAALTTAGVCTGAAQITYDMGANKRIFGYLNSDSGTLVWGSLNNVTYYQLVISNVAAFAGIYRYLQIRKAIADANVNFMKLVVYEI